MPFLKTISLFAVVASLSATNLLAEERESQERRDFDDNRSLTIAVIGDWPYNQNLLDNAPRLVNSVNADKNVSLLMHVGDIHSGSMPCTSSEILPPIATSTPDWNQKIYFQFQQFKVPVVYTPGDNEWTDCHKAKEKSSGDPLKELASVRRLFFAKPGFTLGLHDKQVISQSQFYDAQYPADAKFVENVMWQDSRVVFVTINMPGSNNNTLAWSGIFSNPSAQAQETSERTAADLRWLQTAFQIAEKNHAKAVVIGLQANMWDPEAIAVGGDGLSAYTGFVNSLANLSLHFGKPVLLLNGDSHVYGSDFPLANPSSATGVIHNTPAVPNLQRITVQGSTNAPAEWLRLTINPKNTPAFTWSNVAYCADPLTSCQ